MELRVSSDFGAKDFDGTGVRKIHGHEFLGANTGLAALRGRPDIAALHEKYLSEQKVRIDLFGLREGGGIEGKLHAPLRPTTPVLEPGKSYLVETVVRTLNIGHPLSQGTVDSNEIWVELVAKSDGRVIGRSGGIGPDDQVDPYSHFINVYMLDKHGNRIDRRNPQDIFVPLYNKQIPPGAGQVVHFQLDIPRSHSAPIELEARVNYRKFDRTYFDYIFGKGKGPRLPIVLMARDHVRLAVNGGPSVENAPSPIKDEWQRWNDYGIGLLLEGGTKGGQKGELKQAEEVFKKVVELGKADGWVNLARVYQKEGRSQDAYDALKHASESKEPAAPWVISFLSAGLDERNGFLDSAIEKYTSVLNTRLPERKFDFGVDYEVRNLLGAAEYSRARLAPLQDPKRLERMKQAIATFRKTLEIDSENVAAHYGLGLAFADLLRFHSAGLSSAPVANQDTSGSPPTPKAVDLVAQSEALLEAFRAHPDPTSDSVVAQITALDHAVEAYLAAPREEFTNRVNPLLSLLDRTSPLYDAARNDAERAAMAQLLATTHKALHRMFKPDETAEGIAQRLAREKDPAANLNAQAIVIHSLHRPGAPGTDTPSTDTATRPQGDRKEAFE
jgi:tetratricopeptide (TPR) repeat protein